MSGNGYYSNTNPNAKGGAFGYDGRTGLGIGSLTKGPAAGIGSNWNMGDALSSPKSEYDYDAEDYEEELSYTVKKDTTVRDLAIFAGLVNKEDFEEFDASIERKSHTSYNRTATDSLAHRASDISSLGGLGNSIASVIGLSASKEYSGDTLLENALKEFIRECILLEKRDGVMSGRISVMSKKKGGNLGSKDVYPIDRTSASINTSDAGPEASRSTGISRSAIKRDGYTQSGETPDMYPYSSRTKATTDRHRKQGIEKAAIDYVESAEDFNKGNSTASTLFKRTGKTNKDLTNVKYNKVKKIKIKI